MVGGGVGDLGGHLPLGDRVRDAVEQGHQGDDDDQGDEDAAEDLAHGGLLVD
ncbi:hypothetical protein GCM10029992_09190 [Glycomyces albus]